MDTNAAAQQLLQNQKFVELFQRALGGEGAAGAGGNDFLASMPKEGDPKREEWLHSLQSRLQEETTKEAKKELEQVHSDEQGQWMFVLPTPGFCIKTNVAGGAKVFINVCQHARIAEPVPIDADDGSNDAAEVRYRIPISCGQARPDKDKSGKPCKVYDVIVNPSTITRCGEDSEFRRFVAALCLQWIKQKSEPTLNADEFRNLNFKCKGTLEPQRIRLSNKPKDPNALGDEIKLPGAANRATAPSDVSGSQGTGQLIQEMESPAKRAPSATGSAAQEEADKATVAATAAGAVATPAVVSITPEGTYDWSTHIKPATNPYFKENVPAFYTALLFLPGVQTIREVDVRIAHRKVDCYYVDEVADAEEERLERNTGSAGTVAAPFLSAAFGYPVSDDVVEAKYVRKRNWLKLKVAVQLPDETQAPATVPERDVTEAEEEEERRVQEAREQQWAAAKEQREKQRKEEADVMDERRSYVENLSAVQAGDVPPVVREEVDQMPRDQLPVMLHRLEGRIRKGDSVDVLMEKLPEPMLEALIDYVREKLSLEPRQRAPQKSSTASAVPNAAPYPQDTSAATAAPSPPPPPALQEINATKQAEALIGVAFHNRYLFALD